MRRRWPRATADWERAFWASLPEWEHRGVTAARPTLYACVNRADLLISDVSSVVSDFLASGKPYAVAVGVPALLDAVRHPERDGLVAARAELKRRLLGPDEPSSQERFDRAVQALGAVARRRRLPGQRREEETVCASGTLTLPG